MSGFDRGTAREFRKYDKMASKASSFLSQNMYESKPHQAKDGSKALKPKKK